MIEEPGRSPLGDQRYAAAAHDLVRFRPDPVDEAIRGFVDRTRGLGGQQRHGIRQQLTTDDQYTLLAFVRRRTVQALRDDDLDAAAGAIDALTLVTRDEIDPRDLIVNIDFPLFAVRELGGDLTRTIDRAIARSEAGTARCFEAARERARSLTLARCGRIRVSTAHGVGFMDDWTGTRSPPTALANAVVGLADLIDGEGSYLVRDMHVTRLPAVWFGSGRAVANIDIQGCIGLGADHASDPTPFGAGLLVFVAELPSAQRAIELEQAATAVSNDDRPRAAIRAGQHLALFIGGSKTTGEAPVESAGSLTRFHPLALAVLPRSPA